jgi:hypothetical protein
MIMTATSGGNGLGERLARRMAEVTLQKTAAVGLRHAEANLPYVRQTIADLSGAVPERQRTAIIVSAGPSLHRRHTAARIAAAGFEGIVVASDGALGHCLRAGLVPDFVVSVDPHPTRIVRWFGDPELEARPPDDYFRRQDLDPHLLRDEAERNRELLALVDRHAPRMKAVLSTSVAPSVTRRVAEAGMPMYWWNPIYDDYDAPDSLTRRLFELTKAPCLVTGGNTGAAAWVFATAVVGCREAALVGMDLSYHSHTPITHTQYYAELRELLGDAVAQAYIHVENPHLGEIWYTDPAYWWYRQAFLELAAQSPATTLNCTEGGILYGDSVRWSGLDEFLARHAKAAAR